ncbi:MAG: hypothetical protein WBR18_00770 [Anaerolineales bacterium]
MGEIEQFLHRHLQSIFDGDVEMYHSTTVPDLSIYEWHVTPHRIDGLPFHDFMLAESQREDSAGIALDPAGEPKGQSLSEHTRYDLANYRQQRYGDTVICSYTMLLSSSSERGVRVKSYNESRVIVKVDGAWKVAHVHKSPAWSAPFQAPRP